ncbi:MAG: alpha-glucuronidase family glycosyl hydrolase, partial [Pseudomonadales bacterium]
MNTLVRLLGTLLLLACIMPGTVLAEDGYDLWLRYQPVSAEDRDALIEQASALVSPDNPSATTQVVIDELQRAIRGMTLQNLSLTSDITDGAILIGTPESLPIIAGLNLPLDSLGNEGFLVRSMHIDGNAATVIAANDDIGLLYGSFEYLRQVQTQQDLDQLDITSAPKIELRVLNHWDNLDRSVERGYAGQSIWDWWRLPTITEPRYRDY